MGTGAKQEWGGCPLQPRLARYKLEEQTNVKQSSVLSQKKEEGRLYSEVKARAGTEANHMPAPILHS